MLEKLEYIHGALETAEQCLLDSTGEYGKEEARAWIWAALTELEALRRSPGICLIAEAQGSNYCDAALRAEQREAADVWEQARREAARC